MSRLPAVTWVEDPRLEYVREAALAPREVLRTVKWWRGGRSGPAPMRIKCGRIVRTAQSHGAGTIVETGTFLGNTTAYLAARGFHVHTIELSQQLAERARQRFRRTPNVSVWQGDSGELLRDVLPHVQGRAVFWLDGHYSGGITARGQTDTPILQELSAISVRPERTDDVVLIDDVRCFDGIEYVPLHELLSLAHELGWRAAEVSDDILTLVRRS